MATTVPNNPFDTQPANATNQTPSQQTSSAGIVASALPQPNQAMTYTPETRQVNQATDTVQGQVNSILSKDSPLMQRARTMATQQMAQRGLVNSSMAAGAGTAAMIDRALPIAQQDANTYNATASENMAAKNRATEFGAGQLNQFGMQQGEQQFQASQADINRQFQTSERIGSQGFASQMESAKQNFTAAQAQLDRAQQTALADKSIEAQNALQLAQQNFQAKQADLDRLQQTSLQSSQQSFQAGQAQLDRTQQMSLQTAQQNFTAAQSELERAQQRAMQSTSIQAQVDLQNAQQKFQGAQADLDRAQQSTLQTNQQTFQAGQAALDRAQQTSVQTLQQNFQSAQAALDRALSTAQQDKSLASQQALQTAQQNFQGAQAALDRAQQTSLQVGQQEFQASQQKIQNDFNMRVQELQESGQDFRQARDIASREAMTKLAELGVQNRFDQELALKDKQFNIEQYNLDKRQLVANQNELDKLGLQIKASQAQIPTTFAANISTTAMSGVNAIMADGNLNADQKKAAIDNIVNYANSQINWAEKFYGTTIPAITTPSSATAKTATTTTSTAPPPAPAAPINPVDYGGL